MVSQAYVSNGVEEIRLDAEVIRMEKTWDVAEQRDAGQKFYEGFVADLMTDEGDRLVKQGSANSKSVDSAVSQAFCLLGSEVVRRGMNNDLLLAE